jgi:hypothetical protein
MWPRVVGGASHATARAPSTRLSHSAIWFQLVKIRLTSFRSRELTPKCELPRGGFEGVDLAIIDAAAWSFSRRAAAR